MPRHTKGEKAELLLALSNARAAVVLNGTRKDYIAGIVKRQGDRGEWLWLRFPDGDRGYSYLHLDPV
jgi:hypothetical protein